MTAAVSMPPASPRVAFGTIAVKLSYEARARILSIDEITPLFAAALRLLPADAKPLTAATWFAEGVVGIEDREVAAVALRDFVLGWLERAESPSLHNWQTRADCGL